MHALIKSYSLWLAPCLAAICALLLSIILSPAAGITAGITLWCILWWVIEPVPIPITSLLPLALFPLLGILDANQVAAAYGNPIIILLLGGFLLSRGMESTGTHRRLAVYMINTCAKLTGRSSEKSLLFGFMLAAASLSMWISNTATTLMLLPIALAVLGENADKRLAFAIMLGIAYAANIGGMGTPIGTPPNLIFMQIYTEYTGERVTFSRWMSWGVPAVLLLTPIAAWWLARPLSNKPLPANYFNLPEVGPWQTAEKRVLLVFGVTAVAWITRSEPFGGWSSLLNLPHANDAAIALLAAIALFVVPNGKGEKLLNWEQANSIPWGMLLLFAGGICIAKAFIASGLSASLGNGLSQLANLPTLLMMLLLCLGVSFLTESTSNTATTTLLMPILAAAAIGAGMRIELLMVPAALSASCAFMLPVATAPNAVVFSSGKVDPVKMMQTGVVLNVIGAIMIALICYQLFLIF